jgi:hypothetical protein
MDGKTELLAALISGRARWEASPVNPTLCGYLFVPTVGRYLLLLNGTGCPKVTAEVHRVLELARVETKGGKPCSATD